MLNVNIELVAPVIAVVPLNHWYVKLVPVASTLKLADVPAHVVTVAGCVTITASVLFVTDANELVTMLQSFFTTT